MFIRSSYFAIPLLIFSVVFLIVQSTNAWGFSMFYFFSKDRVMATVVHESLGSQLTKITSYPASSAQSKITEGKVFKVMVQGDSPITFAKKEGYIENAKTAFVCNAMKPLAIVNNPQDARFDVWQLDSVEELNLIKKLSVSDLSSESKNWITYSAVEVACLSPRKLLVAVNYYEPRSKIALYLYDASNNQFSLFAQADVHAQKLDSYFEQIHVSSSEKLILYYSNTKRQSAEIYQNYTNHVVWFSDSYPQGIEILKLSIDDGNIMDWQLNNHNLLLNTIDNRDHKNPKQLHWSLDLSIIMNKYHNVKNN